MDPTSPAFTLTAGVPNGFVEQATYGREKNLSRLPLRALAVGIAGRELLPPALARQHRLKSSSHSDQVCERFCPHLSHDLSPMGLHRDLANTEFTTNLFV